MPKTVAPFPVTPELTAVAVAYKNQTLVADRVLPRVPVSKEVFKYNEFPLEEGFTVPKTNVGRRGKVNEITFSSEEKEASTQDYALDDPIPYADIMNAMEGFDPEAHSVQYLTELLLLDREVRTANLVFDPTKYGAGQKETLAAGDKFSNAESNPIEIIEDSLNSAIMRPNKAVIGQNAYSKLRQHPKVVSAILGNSGTSGLVNAAQLADLFELDEIIVGRAWVNMAKKGKEASLQRTWGNHMLLFYQNTLAMPTNKLVTFGFTGQHGNRVAGSQDDSNIGMRGGKRVRSGESLRELIVADKLAYLIEDVI